MNRDFNERLPENRHPEKRVSHTQCYPSGRFLPYPPSSIWQNRQMESAGGSNE
jgi:hypothetical protein